LKESVARHNMAEILKQLCWLVPEYRPSEMILESLKEQRSIS
jgi:hypothetical protein